MSLNSVLPASRAPQQAQTLNPSHWKCFTSNYQSRGVWAPRLNLPVQLCEDKRLVESRLIHLRLRFREGRVPELLTSRTLDRSTPASPPDGRSPALGRALGRRQLRTEREGFLWAGELSRRTLEAENSSCSGPETKSAGFVPGAAVDSRGERGWGLSRPSQVLPGFSSRA